MNGFLLVRALFALVVIYTATLIQPIDGPWPLLFNGALGLFVVGPHYWRRSAVARRGGDQRARRPHRLRHRSHDRQGHRHGALLGRYRQQPGPLPPRPDHCRAAVPRPRARRAQGRVARAVQVHLALPGCPAAEALSHSRHQRHHRRPCGGHRRDRLPRRHARRAAVRPEGAAVRRRLVGPDQAQPRTPRARRPPPHPEDGRRRGDHFGPRLSRRSRKST